MEQLRCGNTLKNKVGETVEGVCTTIKGHRKHGLGTKVKMT